MTNDAPSAPSIEETGGIPFAQVRNETGETETLHLDVYRAAGERAALRPAVIWFHGGGFTHGNDRRQVYIPRLARAFASRGYTGAAPDYRVRAHPSGDWPGVIRDAVADGRAALDWTLDHAADYGIDPQRIVLAGGSAGGMLILNLAADLLRRPARQPVRALLDLWGTPPAEVRQFGAPGADFPPTFIVHGTADALVDYQNSARFAGELAAAGVRHTLLTLEGAPHTPLAHLEQITAEIERFLGEVA